MSEAADQPAAEAPVAEAPAGVEAEAPATTSDDISTDDFDRVEAPDDDAEGAGDGQPDGGDPEGEATEPTEFEFEADDGTKHKLPKALETALLRQADYTKKTQALAERGRELDTKATELTSREAQQTDSLREFRTEHLAVANQEAVIAGIDEQLAAYAKLTPEEWTALRTEKPDDYEAHRAKRQLLRDTRADYVEALESAKKDLASKETAFTEKQAAAKAEGLAKAWTDTNATLATKIKDWSPAKGQELGEFMVKEFGVEPEELPEATDARVWIMADEVHRLRAENARLKTSQTQRSATETALKSQTVTPAARPAGGGAKPTGVRDDLATAEWMRRRNAQVAKRRA